MTDDPERDLHEHQKFESDEDAKHDKLTEICEELKSLLIEQIIDALKHGQGAALHTDLVEVFTNFGDDYYAVFQKMTAANDWHFLDAMLMDVFSNRTASEIAGDMADLVDFDKEAERLFKERYGQ